MGKILSEPDITANLEQTSNDSPKKEQIENWNITKEIKTDLRNYIDIKSPEFACKTFHENYFARSYNNKY